MHHRPRPVADAPRAEGAAVARAWVLELIAGAPLETLPSLPAAELAREAPVLCGAVLAAVRDDDALERLAPGGELETLAARAGHLAGAETPAETAAAIAALRTAAWSVLWDELRSPPPGLVADLSARLAHVCSVVEQCALGARPAQRRAPAAPPFHGHPVTEAQEPEPESGDEPERSAAEPPAGLFVVTDTREAPTAQDPWLTAIDRRLERHRTDRSPFAVLAVEIDDVERIVASEPGSEVATAVQGVERAISDALRPADMLVRERLGRYWITAPDTDPAGARVLGERIAEATGDTAPLRGAPLTVSIGLASCPQDGENAGQLAARADEGVFAARAAGVRIA
jgi:GGDEF domain-containing protein